MYIKDILKDKNKDITKGIWRKLSNVHVECGKGWYNLIIELMEEIEKVCGTEVDNLEILQIKEKYGALLVYASTSVDEVFQLLCDYEIRSRKVCELCGKFGILCIKNYWIKTLCPSCKEKMGFKDDKILDKVWEKQCF